MIPYENSAMFAWLSHQFGWSNFKLPELSHQFITSNLTSAELYRKTLSAIVSEAQAKQIPIVLSSFISIAHPGLDIDYKDNPGIFDTFYKLLYPLTAGEIAQIYEIFNQQSASVAQEFKVPYANLAAQFPKKIEYFPFDILHFSPQGNKILAHLFAEFLVENGLLKTTESTTALIPGSSVLSVLN